MHVPRMFSCSFMSKAANLFPPSLPNKRVIQCVREGTHDSPFLIPIHGVHCGPDLWLVQINTEVNEITLI